MFQPNSRLGKNSAAPSANVIEGPTVFKKKGLYQKSISTLMTLIKRMKADESRFDMHW